MFSGNIELVLEGIYQSLPAGFDNIFTHADRTPDVFFIRAFDHHPHAGGRDSVSLKIDGKEVANYLYTQREVDALIRGGVHRVHMANLKTGDHELIAIFTGKGPHTRDYRRGATVTIEKGIGSKYLELEITDRVKKLQPEFVIKEWE